MRISWELVGSSRPLACRSRSGAACRRAPNWAGPPDGRAWKVSRRAWKVSGRLRGRSWKVRAPTASGTRGSPCIGGCSAFHTCTRTPTSMRLGAMCGLVWFGVVWLVRLGVAWCGLHGRQRFGVAWCDAHAAAGMAGRCLVWFSLMWFGLLSGSHEHVQQQARQEERHRRWDRPAHERKRRQHVPVRERSESRGRRSESAAHSQGFVSISRDVQ